MKTRVLIVGDEFASGYDGKTYTPCERFFDVERYSVTTVYRHGAALTGRFVQRTLAETDPRDVDWVVLMAGRNSADEKLDSRALKAMADAFLGRDDRVKLLLVTPFTKDQRGSSYSVGNVLHVLQAAKKPVDFSQLFGVGNRGKMRTLFPDRKLTAAEQRKRVRLSACNAAAVSWLRGPESKYLQPKENRRLATLLTWYLDHPGTVDDVDLTTYVADDGAILRVSDWRLNNLQYLSEPVSLNSDIAEWFVNHKITPPSY